MIMIEHAFGIAFGLGVFALLVLAWAIAIALIIVPIIVLSMGIAWTIEHMCESRRGAACGI